MLPKTLSKKFAMFAVVAESSEVLFEKVIAHVKAKITRRKMSVMAQNPKPVTGFTKKPDFKDDTGQKTRFKVHVDSCFVCHPPRQLCILMFAPAEKNRRKNRTWQRWPKAAVQPTTSLARFSW